MLQTLIRPNIDTLHTFTFVYGLVIQVNIIYIEKGHSLQWYIYYYSFNRKIMIGSKSKKTLKIMPYSNFITLSDKDNTHKGNPLPSPTLRAKQIDQSISKKDVPQSSQKQSNKKQHQDTQKANVGCHNYFLRKTILVLYKFFESMQASWFLEELSYRQMLLILKELKYIKCLQEDVGAENSEQLRKCYYLWINLTQGKQLNLVNLIIVLCHIQKLDCDSQLINQVVKELYKGIQKFATQSNSLSPFPNFIFYCKKERWNFENGFLKLDEHQIKQVRKNFSSFLFTRWTQNEPKVDLEQSKENHHPLVMSKKSIELAGTKRQRILEEIRQRQPQIQCIQLHHILNFKQNNCNSKGKSVKTQTSLPCQMPKKGKQNKKTYKIDNIQKDFNGKQQKLKTAEFNKKVYEKPQTNQKNTGKKYTKAKNRVKINSQPNQKQKLSKEAIPQQNWSKRKSKAQIIDELQWQQIPRRADQIQVQQEMMNFRQQAIADLLLPHNHLLPRNQATDKQKKRRQYIDLPILYVDVNIQEGKKQRIVIYEGDKAKQLAIQFGKKHGLSEQTVGRLESMLEQQIGSVLSKIDEAFQQDCSYLF